MPRTSLAPQTSSAASAAPAVSAAPQLSAPLAQPAAAGLDGAAGVNKLSEASSDAAQAGAAVESSEDLPYETVEVFYGTNRQSEAAPVLTDTKRPWRFVPSATAMGFSILLLGIAVFVPRQRLFYGGMTVAGLLVSGVLGYAAWKSDTLVHRVERTGPRYLGGRGQLELGRCEVSIPRSHSEGELESPSILRLEIDVDASRHVAVQSVVREEEKEFLAALKARVQESPRKDAFIFVHGFNVTFDNAARRTAQIAHDLEFTGTPLFFSWPSQGNVLKYTVDETNAQWAVQDMKRFLHLVGTQSGAQRITLVVHSMGNRVVGHALRELRQELPGTPPIFTHIVLAAPDVDADVFRRDIAPALAQSAERVTLYASSDDRALIASKQVHGYSRAGESGAGLVLINGIETVDVSGIDTSLLGHSYYGSSQSILVDLHQLVHRSLPPTQRRWLSPASQEGLMYWIFDSRRVSSVAPPLQLQ